MQKTNCDVKDDDKERRKKRKHNLKKSRERKGREGVGLHKKGGRGGRG